VIRASLLPTESSSLKVRLDGTVRDGHHRLSILLERGENIDALPRDRRTQRATASSDYLMNPDLFWIPGPWRGRLAVVTRPRGGDLLNDGATGWRRANIDIVVSLLERDEAAQLDLEDERSAAEANSIGFLWFPIPDRGVPASLPATVSLLADIARSLEEGKNVAVHGP